MYLCRCYRRKNGKRHGYWALVESYRSPRGPRQRVVAYLGEMDAAGRLGRALPASCSRVDGQLSLFLRKRIWNVTGQRHRECYECDRD